MLTYGEPPAWDAFSKVNASELKEEDYLSDSEIEERKMDKEMALVKAKPRSIDGWDPEKRQQSILTDEMMQMGSGMGAMDLDHWKVQSLVPRNEGETHDCSYGPKTVMKKLLKAGEGTTNPQAPSQVEISYVCKVRQEDDSPESLVPSTLVVDDRYATQPGIFRLERQAYEGRQDDGRFPVVEPSGLRKAIRTMRVGERAKITVLPVEAYGAEGDESRGIPPDAYLEFEVTLHRIIPVNLYDSYGILKRTLRHANNGPDGNLADPRHRNAQPNAEVVVRWEGHVVEDTIAPGEALEPAPEPFWPMAEERFWLGDPSTPPWWQACLSAFRVGETSELTIDARSGFGDAGSAKYNVPAACTLRVVATLVSVHAVADLSERKDRTRRLKVLRPVEDDILTPMRRYDCTIDFTASVLPSPPVSLPQNPADDYQHHQAPGVSREQYVVTLGTPLREAAELRAACEGFDVDAALQLMLPKMHLGEASELLVEVELPPSPPPFEARVDAVANAQAMATAKAEMAAYEAALAALDRSRVLRVVCTLHSWIAVDEVPGTGGDVLKREVRRNTRMPGEPFLQPPPPESVCRVRYTCRVAGEGEAYGRGLALGEVIEAVGTPSAEGKVQPWAMEDIASGAIKEFTQGERHVMPCIDAAVLLMHRGERCLVTAPARWAFNAPSFPPAEQIEPRLRGSDVEILIELVDFDSAADEDRMPIPDKVLLHASRKEAANRLFAKGALREAIAKWELAEKTLPHGGSLRFDLSRSGRPADVVEAEKAVCEKIQLSCQLNLAATYLKFDEARPALDNANKALKIDPQSVKGLFRRAQAKLRIPPVDVDDVKADLMAAGRLDPKSKEIRDELERLKQVRSQQVAEEKGLFGGMFEKPKAKEGGLSFRSKWEQEPTTKPRKTLEGFASTAFGTRSKPAVELS